MKNLFAKSLTQKEAILGYSGGVSYWITDHFDIVAGMILSTIMIVSSIFLQYYKIKAIQNEERRRQEEHDMRMQQNIELHNRDLQGKK
jgi:hypothetical protein